MLKHCLWEAICVGLEPQPLPYSITQAQPYAKFPKIYPGKIGPICPSTALQAAKNTLSAYDMDAGCIWSLSHYLTNIT